MDVYKRKYSQLLDEHRAYVDISNAEIGKLKAENERLREYFEAKEAVDKAGLLFAEEWEIERVIAARDALLKGDMGIPTSEGVGNE